MGASPTQLGRPKQIVLTGPSNEAVTIKDLDRLAVKPDHESHVRYANRRFPRTTIGNDMTEISFETTDVTAFQELWKDAVVKDIACTWEGTASTIDQDGTVTINAGTYTYTCTHAKVKEVVEVSPEVDGQPAKFSVTMMPAIDETDDSEPEQDFVFNPGEAEEGPEA